MELTINSCYFNCNVNSKLTWKEMLVSQSFLASSHINYLLTYSYIFFLLQKIHISQIYVWNFFTYLTKSDLIWAHTSVLQAIQALLKWCKAIKSNIDNESVLTVAFLCNMNNIVYLTNFALFCLRKWSNDIANCHLKIEIQLKG